MKSCTSRQHQMDHLAMGDPGFAMSQDVYQELSRHTENCPACSEHALALLALGSMKSSTLQGPTKASEERLMAALPQNRNHNLPTWVRAAGLILALCGTFVLGKHQGDPEERQQSDQATNIQAEEKSVPTISLNRHVYDKGFLTGRTLVVHGNQ